MIDTIKDFIKSSQQMINDNIDQYNSYCIELQKGLEFILGQAGQKNLIIQTRVKSGDSLSEKIYRKNYYNKYNSPKVFIENLPDVIGVRVVCLLNSDEDIIFSCLQSGFCKQEKISEILYSCKDIEVADKLLLDFSNQPQKQKNGHSLYKISCKWFNAERNEYTNVELQIKSLVHLFWGELDHMLFYKNYSYLISNGFYSLLMDKINAELENIDSQLMILRNQMDKTNEKEVEELKQIASLILYNKYNSSVVENLECTIDLREVFDLIVDMHFRNTGDKKLNYRRLHELISDIGSKNFNRDVINCIDNSKLKENDFTLKDKKIAFAIERKLKEQDIFWTFFYAIYASHFLKEEEQNYSTIIKIISNEFILMLKEFEDDIERIDDECDTLYDAFIDEIYKGLSQAFEHNAKLSFFIYNLNLNRINIIIKQIVRKFQGKISNKYSELVSRNLCIISLYTQCCVMAATEKKVDLKFIRELKEFLDKEDYFEVSFDQSYFEGDLKEKEFISDEEYFKLFSKEGE